MRIAGRGNEGAVSEDEDDDVTSGHDLCELRGHVTFRDRSLNHHVVI